MQKITKIVFILATHTNTNNLKRIEAFVNNGYDVAVYSFSRGEGLNKTTAAEIQIIGEFSNDLPYLRRLRIMYKGIRYVLNETKGQKCVYYLIRNDVALFFSFMSSRPYIFEEADMTHVNFKNGLLVRMLERKIKSIINHSIISAFRSEGFLHYHFGNNIPENVLVIPNKLSPQIKTFPKINKKRIDYKKMKFGFVGVIRGRATYDFAFVLLKHFPQHEFHFFGNFATSFESNLYGQLEKYDRCFFHGKFKSPDDLSNIYSQIDIVLANYETSIKSVNYLEPNKLYEAIYFETPIIVPSGTFMANKVKKLGIGFDIQSQSSQQIYTFIMNLNEKDIEKAICNAKSIDKEKECISNGYMRFFNERLK